MILNKKSVFSGEVLLGILGGGGGVPADSLNPDPISDQKMYLSAPVSGIHTRFQTWPLGRNFVIVT